ncbi:MAG: metal-sensitive transcriptional regulator [Chloroflexi bacterium]|nr:metal-sensitive transcriptional regulator [Chloroflexota bacterium]
MPLTEDVQQEIMARLRRIEGQARGVQRMVENGRDCAEIISQLASIRAALYSASVLLLKNYARECAVRPSEYAADDRPLEDLVELMLRSPH